LGLHSSIRAYADLAASWVESWISEPRTAPVPKFVTSPPRASLPSAANLLVDQIANSLHIGTTPSAQLLLLPKAGQSAMTPRHYASLTPAERLAYQRNERHTWVPVQNVMGASVLVVNDVYVTGAQQDAMARYLNELGVRRVAWLYLFRIRAAGDRAASLEARLNAVGVENLEAFLALVAEPELTPTTRFVWRLLELESRSFELAARTLPAQRARQIARQFESGTLVDGDLHRRLRLLAGER
jgi:hypothetical protein